MLRTNTVGSWSAKYGLRLGEGHRKLVGEAPGTFQNTFGEVGMVRLMSVEITNIIGCSQILKVLRDGRNARQARRDSDSSRDRSVMESGRFCSLETARRFDQRLRAAHQTFYVLCWRWHVSPRQDVAQICCSKREPGYGLGLVHRMSALRGIEA